MKSGIKIIHWIIFVWICIAILQFNLIIEYYSLIAAWFGLLFSDSSSAFSFLTFSLIDSMLSVVIFLIIILIIILYRNRIRLLKAKLNFSFAVLTLLLFVFLFAPIITNENPGFSKNLSVTKLLPPFTSVSEIVLNTNKPHKLSTEESFRIKLDRTIKPPFNDNIILADSVNISDSVIYYQGNQVNTIGKNLADETGIQIRKKFYLLGTDEYGRDVFARLIYGSRVSITVGLSAVVLSFIIGIILGFIAGYRGGFIDIILNRFTEMFLAFPVIYLIVLILALFGSSIFSVIIVLGISGWMSLFKIVKTEVLSIKQKDFFASAELIGLKNSLLLKKEIFPVIVYPVIINLIFLFSNIILAEAALSYLGLGTGSSYPSWGSMINSGQEYITKAWWLIVFPGAALILTLFTFNSAGKNLGKLLNPGIVK